MIGIPGSPLPPTPLSPQLDGVIPSGSANTNIMDSLLTNLNSDTMKDTIKAHRSKLIPPGALPPNPMVAAEAMNVVLRKTGGPGKPLPPPPSN